MTKKTLHLPEERTAEEVYKDALLERHYIFIEDEEEKRILCPYCVGSTTFGSHVYGMVNHDMVYHCTVTEPQIFQPERKEDEST